MATVVSIESERVLVYSAQSIRKDDAVGAAETPVMRPMVRVERFALIEKA
jgi:hypothetical protein